MSIDCGYHQLGRFLQTQKSFVRVKAEIVFERRCDISQHVDVSAGTKELLAFTRYHNDLNSIIHPRIENGAVELLHHLVGISVGWWIVKGEDRNTVCDLVIN